MEIVINIPEEIYSYVNTQWRDIPKNDSPISILCNAVIDGTPLPKGHGALKDADIYKAEVYKYIAENKNSDDLYLAGCGDGAYHALHIYDCIPTIIEAESEEE